MSDMQMPELVAVCPDCGSEFQPHVTRCIDCGAQTRSTWAAPDLPRVEREQVAVFGFSLPPDSEASAVRITSDLGWAKRLGSLLEQRGVPCRIDVGYDASGSPHYAVCVAEGDLERAEELDREHLRVEMPDGAAFTELPPADECPACGSHVSFDETECPSCGLVLDEPEESHAT